MKNNSTLEDLKRIYANIRCESEYCSCNNCSNKEICDKIQRMIKSIEK